MIYEHLRLLPFVCGIRVAQSLVFCVVFCTSLFVHLSNFLSHCISVLYQFALMSTPLVFSKLSTDNWNNCKMLSIPQSNLSFEYQFCIHNIKRPIRIILIVLYPIHTMVRSDEFALGVIRCVYKKILYKHVDYLLHLGSRDRMVVGYTTTCANQCLSPLML